LITLAIQPDFFQHRGSEVSSVASDMHQLRSPG
jgi:hypothetical protein